jgi:CBS domain-containing protein
MDTAAISYRVADFLKKHPPFHTVDEADLVGLAAHGRVRFYEANDFLLWQGEPHRAHVFVIQQGTVSLWDEADGQSELRDMLGAGDMLGVERFNGASQCMHSARAGSDVVIYTFPAEEFADLLERYPHAMQYVAAHGGVTAGYVPAGLRQQPHERFLHDLVKDKTLHTCTGDESVRGAARRIIAGADAIAVVDQAHRVRAIVTPHDLVDWIALDGADSGQPITCVPHAPAMAVPLNATVTDGALMMAQSKRGVVVITADGTTDGRVHAVVSAHDVARVFGDQPISILHDIALARNLDELGALNLRARRFTLEHLTGPPSLAWLAQFTHLVDVHIVRRIIALGAEQPGLSTCWCFYGAAGRGESLTLAAPGLAVIVDDEQRRPAAEAAYRAVLGALADCGYLAQDGAVDPSLSVASAAEWKARYEAWVRDPILQETYKARPLFDLRGVCGPQSLWQDLATTVRESVGRKLLHVLANDCLANLPPLTFFQDAVVDDAGEFAEVFRLDESVLSPLVEVGRVFGLAAGAGLGCSTLERFAMAQRVFATHDSIFIDAA